MNNRPTNYVLNVTQLSGNVVERGFYNYGAAITAYNVQRCNPENKAVELKAANTVGGLPMRKWEA